MINDVDLGKINAFLIKCRVVETKAREGRKLRPQEREVGKLLKEADETNLRTLRAILQGQGLDLREKNDFDVGGIPVGGQVFLAVREQFDDSPIKVGEDMLGATMKIRKGESQEEVVTWYLYLWFQHLAFLYSREARCISEVSKYSEAEFTLTAFSELVEESINKLRQSEAAESAPSDAKFYAEYLLAERNQDIPRRITKFLEVMVTSGQLEKVPACETDTYKQTLLSSIELAESYEANMDTLVPKAKEIAELNDLPDEYTESEHVTS